MRFTVKTFGSAAMAAAFIGLAGAAFAGQATPAKPAAKPATLAKPAKASAKPTAITASGVATGPILGRAKPILIARNPFWDGLTPIYVVRLAAASRSKMLRAPLSRHILLWTGPPQPDTEGFGRTMRAPQP